MTSDLYITYLIVFSMCEIIFLEDSMSSGVIQHPWTRILIENMTCLENGYDAARFDVAVHEQLVQKTRRRYRPSSTS